VQDGKSNQYENRDFVEVRGRVHRATDLGTENVVVINTFIVPKRMPTKRTDSWAMA